MNLMAQASYVADNGFRLARGGCTLAKSNEGWLPDKLADSLGNRRDRGRISRRDVDWTLHIGIKNCRKSGSDIRNMKEVSNLLSRSQWGWFAPQEGPYDKRDETTWVFAGSV